MERLQDKDGGALEIFTAAAQAKYAEAAAEFPRYLYRFPDVKDYVYSRGLNDGDIAAAGVGFCPPYLQHWFPLLRGRVIVPIRDAYGRYVAFAGRKYDPMAEMTHRAFREHYRGDAAKIQERIQAWDGAKWINEVYKKKRHLYNLDVAKPFIRKRGYALIMEGYMDVRVCSSRGLRNSVAQCGTTLSEIHAQLLRRYTDRCVLLLDPDEAGQKAVEEGRKVLAAAGHQVLAVHLSHGFDPDEFVLRHSARGLHDAIVLGLNEGLSDLDLGEGGDDATETTN